MKKLWLISTGTAFILTFAYILHAQEITPADSIVQLTAEARGLSLVSAADVPEAGTFWLVLTNGIAPDPAPLFDPGLPVYAITTNGEFLVDATDGQVDTEGQPSVAAALAAQAAAVVDLINQVQAAPPQPAAQSQRAGGLHALDEGGGFTPALSLDTNGLYLQILSVRGGTASLILNNSTGEVYAILSKTDLGATNWTIEPQEVWPTNGTAMPFTISELDRTNLFVLAQDWSTAMTNGLYYWWLWENFQSLDYTAGTLDSQGNTLGYDYSNNLDPNVIEFYLQFTNTAVGASPAYGAVRVLGGTPFYEAMLLNDSNISDAVWQPYTSSNVTVNLPANGLYNVMFGLKGLPNDAQPTWQLAQLTLYAAPSTLTLTNPTSGTVTLPMMELQGYAAEALDGVTYDVSNAAGVFTNQTGEVTGRYYDTNLLAFTTNYFECDLTLAGGVNALTLKATDFAGDLLTTNFNLTLAQANAPNLTILWPPADTAIGGSAFTLQAQVDDATAQVTASITDTNGDATVVPALVERNGTVWVKDLPLSGGTNLVTLTATNAAGLASATNFNVVQSAVSVTIDPLASGQLNRTNVTVTGTVSDPAADVWVNGMEVDWYDDTDWYADDVPVSATGTVHLTVQAGTDLSQIEASQTLDQAQPATLVPASYYNQAQDDGFGQDIDGNPYPFYDHEAVNWFYHAGGADDASGYSLLQHLENPATDGSYAYTTDIAGGQGSLLPPWEYADMKVTEDETAGDNGYIEWQRETRTRVMIEPAGQEAAGGTSWYLVSASAKEYSNPNQDTYGIYLSDSPNIYGDVPLPPEWMQIQGRPLVDSGITNADGSEMGLALVSAPAGLPVDVTPTFTRFYTNQDVTFTNMQVFKTKEDWQSDMRTEINQDSGFTAVISEYLASNGFSIQNRTDIKAVYAFYQKLYLEQPTEYYWCGLAKLAGAPVYAGLSDAQNATPILTGFQQTIIQMNIDILNDIAWQFEAYRKGGLQALEVIYAVDTTHTNLDLNAIGAWQEIDQGIQQNNQALILEGNEDLLKREQQQVLPDDYAVLSSFDTILMSIFAQCPIWNSSEAPYPGRDFSTIMGSGHNVANTTDRWNWITYPTYGIWDTWVNLSSDDKSSQVSTLLTTRAVTYSTFPSILFNY